ncbi:hypothetical protein SAMN05444004_11410 [Jannaschia faecimaris]|uniref:Uncharacterized protein n=1 Tax=Jannaschia faecimaris TaxID=1244108 RepID=A0A1H3SYN6_9RHOB|nr:hypothetical protein [Jannaschia faecimaris]SDZ42199.1 hypothetical protein SAMN05444004_11410 [Jannaschia faecimaris]
MTPTRRAIAFWIIRVAIAVILVLILQAWRGPDPVLWYLAAGYAAISAFTTYVIIKRRK